MFPKPTKGGPRKAKPIKRGKSLGQVRAERKAEGPGVSDITWLAIMAWYDWRCAYCRVVPRPKSGLTQDHVVPLAKDGQHEPSNVVPACHTCNMAKGKSTVQAFMRRKAASTWPQFIMHPYKW